MWQPKPTLLLLLLLPLLLAVSLRACTAEPGGKPLVTTVTKDPSTYLYIAPLDNGHPLVLNLSASAVTSPCSSSRGGGGSQKKMRVITLSANATDGRNPLAGKIEI
ncbi:basic 7S globulin-like [Hordeum vulgare]|nr:basic 7S globulin-like [Hordeum vulgare]